MAAPKKINHAIIERHKDGPAPYRMMDELIAAHHPHLAEAKIVLAYRFGWNEDADGRLVLGQARKASDIDRDLHDYDFIILLNADVWNEAGFSEAQQRALIDHELCHCAVVYDENDEPKIDEHGRTVYRIRKHDIEEFQEVVDRHGCWKKDIRDFAERAMEKAKAPLIGLAEAV